MRAGVALVVGLLAACAPAAPPPEPPASGASGAWLLPGTDWRLVAMNGAAYPGRVTATLTEDGRVIGEAPCNRFAAPYTGRWPDLTFAPAATTRMACADLAAENAFFASLAAVNRAAIDADAIMLTGADGVSLRFERTR